MNFDEESNFRVAMSHHIGKGYTYNNYPSKIRKKTAFHSSFSVFVYEFLIENKIKKKIWVIACNILSAVLLSISIILFFKICSYIFKPQWAFITTLLYCIFPSVVFYVGTLFWYEQIVLSLLIIIIYWLFKLINGQKLSLLNWILLAVSAAIATLFRLHTLPIIILMFCVMFFYFIQLKQLKTVFAISSIIVLICLSHVPSLVKNKNIFGVHIISTQFGYEVLQGHNPYAKGSWMNGFWLPKNPFYQYAHNSIANLDSLNEYDEGNARLALATKWIQQNPTTDLKLEIRKLVLFFAPFNFEFLPFHHIPNPINFIVYMGFLLFVILFFLNKIQHYKWQFLLLIIPVICSITLTIIFFMGARWRYYSEPFMIIFAMLAFQFYYKKMQDKRLKSKL